MTHDPTAPETSDKPVEETGGRPEDARRDELATRLVDRFSVWAGAAGLIPLPLLDVVTVAGVQLQMLRRLSEIYGVPFSENRGKSIIASIAGSVIPASSTVGLASALKSIPGLGTAIGSAVMPLASAGATWVTGRVFIEHFASGGTLLDFNLPDYREFIKTQKEKWRAEHPESAGAPEKA